MGNLQKRLSGLWMGVLLATLPAAGPLAGQQPVYHVGVSEVDITPDYPVRLNGFGGRREPADSVRQRLWAKALAIDDGTHPPLVLLAIDNLGIRRPMVDALARQLEQSHNIPRQNVAVTFTHTHCAPKVSGASDNIFSTPIPAEHQANIDRYSAELAGHLYRAASAALDQRRPAHLSWLVGQVRFATNRRTPGGPVDHDLPTLFVTDPSGAIRAIYASYACHCVALTENQISGDWAGYAQELVQRQFPGSICLLSIGAGSDSNPDVRQSDDTADAAIQKGAEILAEVKRLAAVKAQPIGGQISCQLNQISLPLQEVPSRAELEAIRDAGGPEGYNAQTQLDRQQRGEELLDHIDYPIQSWCFGDQLAMVFLAGEVCVDYSLRLKRELDAGRLWLNAYSNDFCSYIPSERLLREGGYGGGAEIPYFALPAALRPGLEEKIIGEVHRQLPSFEQGDRSGGIPPQTPEQSRACIRVREGLQVQLVASEPLISDPVAIDFDPGGGLWVAEMPDYNHEVDESFPPRGQIKYLADSDGDGEMDRATVFADGLRFPTDVKVWRDGVLVCDAPDILFLQDTDGDGRADVREVRFSGFATHNPHGRVNSLRWELDHWVRGSCGLFGGDVVSHTGERVALGARDFRIQPDRGRIEPATGKTQQGMARSDWGDWFGCDNSTLAWHYPLTERDSPPARFLTPPPSAVAVAVSSQLFPPPEIVRFNLTGPPGRPTSACGLEIYRDTLLGQEFYGDCFVAEPVNQLVHRLKLQRQGNTFVGRRADDEVDREFLVSTDRWFRPVQLRTGLDGGLWVVDMYRFVIEHKRWIPDETEQEIDLFAGKRLGRIYRIVPVGWTGTAAQDLRRMTSAALVSRLERSGGPARDLIHQLILWRNDASAAPALIDLAVGCDNPAVRLQALCMVDGLVQNAPADDPLRARFAALVQRALRDPHPQVRRHAIRLAQPLMAADPTITGQLLQRKEDQEPEVVLAFATAMISMPDDQSTASMLSELAMGNDDPYVRYALLTSISVNRLSAVLDQVLQADRPLDPGLAGDLTRLAFGFRDSAAIQLVLDWLVAPSAGPFPAWKLDRLSWLLNNYRGDVESFFASPERAGALRAVVASCRRMAFDSIAAFDVRRASIQLLVAADPQEQRRVAQLIDPAEPIDIQIGAIEALAQCSAEDLPNLLLDRWPAASPNVRRQIADTLLQREAWTSVLLEQCGTGAINPNQIDISSQQRLINHTSREIQRIAESIFQRPTALGREKLVARYAASVGTGGNRARGQAVFAQHCSGCHRLESTGFDIGPDLAALTTRNRQWLLETILDPNRQVDSRYFDYLVVLQDGRMVSGIIGEETGSSLLLRQRDGQSLTILRGEIDQLRSSGISMMPEGLEKEIDADAMSDLLEYLSSLAAAPKSFAGNRPRRVQPDADGQLVLGATAGQIFGQDIVFESNYQNIGYWHGAQDYVVWEVESDGGRFDLFLSYACADETAGNRFRIDGLETVVEVTVAGTGTWDDYRALKVGTAVLPAGARQIVVSPAGPVRGALMDLRAIMLVPRCN